MNRSMVAGWRCAVCGRTVDVSVPLSWRCPNATEFDRHHALGLVETLAPLSPSGSVNPFVAFREWLAWDGFAAAHGLTGPAREAIVLSIDAAVAGVAGAGFVATPFGRADALSEALGFAVDGGVWVKDETNNVAGSHKARHLFTILLHLVTVEQLGLAPWGTIADRPHLAISSCGNAAIAAATLAVAVDWPISVFVPPAASVPMVARLRELGASVVVCLRRPNDLPGDPCVHRFREAVAAGAIPFSVQGTENAWCLDGGRTIGWEMARQLSIDSAAPLDRLFVQVGGGAFAASLAAGLRSAGALARLHAVQTASCAPLERAWRRAAELGGPAVASRHWDECMWPWEAVGQSAADGILDDETYDWIPVLDAMAAGGGTPVIATEADVLRANKLAVGHTSIAVSPTGSAGLAGLVAIRDQVGNHERVAVVFSGVGRPSPRSFRPPPAA